MGLPASSSSFANFTGFLAFQSGRRSVHPFTGQLHNFGLRFLAIRYGLRLPAARLSAQRRAESDAAGEDGRG